jgi:hypothetical protein
MDEPVALEWTEAATGGRESSAVRRTSEAEAVTFEVSDDDY